VSDRTNDQQAGRAPPSTDRTNDRTTGPEIGAAWLTYAQIGERFGMSPEAARQRARRLRWRTQPGNDGRTLVLVPESTAVQPRGRPPDRTAEQSPVQPPEIARLSGLLDRAHERADKAEQRADAADAVRRAAEALAERERERADDERQGRERAETRADRAAAAIAGERQRADVLRDRLDAVRAQITAAEAAAEQGRVGAQAAQDAAEALRRADDARKARGLVARLRAAWRGE
jgi:hypothetical protein